MAIFNSYVSLPEGIQYIRMEQHHNSGPTNKAN